MGPPSYMRSVADRNVVVRRIPVLKLLITAATPFEMVCPWCVHGVHCVSTVCPWCVHGVSMVRPWCVHGVHMVCPRCVHGVTMVCPWRVQYCLTECIPTPTLQQPT